MYIHSFAAMENSVPRTARVNKKTRAMRLHNTYAVQYRNRSVSAMMYLRLLSRREIIR